MFDEQSTFHFDADVFSAARPILHPKQKAKRDAIKAAGGAEYEALLKREREGKAHRRMSSGRPSYDRANRRTFPFKTWLCSNTRFRGRKKGLPATIRPEDLHWPTHCPVLGIALDYPDRSGQRGIGAPKSNWPSLDRWDSSKGYVPGNVFVISFRANTLKNNSSYEEILRLAKYMAKKPSP